MYKGNMKGITLRIKLLKFGENIKHKREILVINNVTVKRNIKMY